jgi:lysophospholipase L1-like esterase
MARPLFAPLLDKMTPFLQPAGFGLLLVVAGAGLACSGSDEPGPGTGGQNSGGSAGASAGTTSVAGGGSAAAGMSSSGGSVGTAGAGTGGVAPTAGTGGGSAGGSGGAGTAGSSATGGGAGAGATHWVGTWTASPYLAAGDAQPAAALSNSVLRQVTHASLGGPQIRVQFSNRVGNGPVTIKSAHVALCKATPKVDGSIDTATDKALSFSGMPGVTIAQGMEIWSDPVDFTVPPLGNVTITTALGSVPSDLTAHAGARTNSYVQANSTDVSAANLSSAPHNLHWYFISAIDVMAPTTARGIVAIGDSITDGRGTTDDGNDRWTDYLAARLQANAATADVSVMNQGIGATNLVGTGTAAEARFARDVLGQSGVKYVIVLDGVNDINGSDGSTLAKMKAVYDKMIQAAHDKSLLIYGGTITPFGGNNYWTMAHETLRQDLNTYIKSGVFDGVIDFDAAVTDGTTGNMSPKLSAASASTDGLHPGPAGYKLMADKADLMLFTK